MLVQSLFLLCLVFSGDALECRQACLAMHNFGQTYDLIQDGVEKLLSQMRNLKEDLDNSINGACVDNGNYPGLSTFNLTYCDFEHGSCFFDTRYGYWRVDTGNPDHTFGEKTGHYLGSHSSNHQLVSAPFDRSSAYCLKFFYRAYRNPFRGTFNIYVTPADKSFGNPIRTITTANSSWTLMEIPITGEYLKNRIKFAMSAINSYGILVDDIMVYNTNCTAPGVQQPICSNTSYTRQNVGGSTSCYTFHISPKSWTEAAEICKQQWPFASLVSIESAGEQQYLVNLISGDRDLSQTGQHGYWTSGNDVNTEGSYVWAGTMKALNYTNWNFDQPNNVGGTQDCVLLQYPNSGYKWGDVECNEKHPFICEARY